MTTKFKTLKLMFFFNEFQVDTINEAYLKAKQLIKLNVYFITYVAEFVYGVAHLCIKYWQIIR